MANKPMNYLDDPQFHRWMAVCAKKNLKSDDLLNAVIVNYTNKNLSDAEFDEYVRNARSVDIAKELLRKHVIKNGKTTNGKVAVVKIENVNKILTEKTISVVKVNRMINVDDVSLGDDITSEKVKVIRKMYGGKMEVK